MPKKCGLGSSLSASSREGVPRMVGRSFSLCSPTVPNRGGGKASPRRRTQEGFVLLDGDNVDVKGFGEQAITKRESESS